MNTAALITMLITMSIVTFFMGYFFYKVLTIKPNPEPDSYTDNEEDEHKEI